MIKNAKQLTATLAKLAEIKKVKADFEQSSKEGISSLRIDVALNSFDALIKDLQLEIEEYNELVKGNIPYLKNKTLENIASIFISARLTQKLSHRELAERLGINEQQVQRYEATSYESASLVRLLEVAEAMNLELKFKDIAIVNHNDINFVLPKGVIESKVSDYENRVKNEGSLLLT